jgi:hypothetical protein
VIYPTRMEARRAGYAASNSEANFRLLPGRGGWSFELCEQELSEHARPTFEFFNEQHLRSAQLGSLYKAAMALGVQDCCTIKRAELVEIVLARLNEMGYDLTRPVPESLTTVVRPQPKRRREGGSVARVWAIADTMEGATRGEVVKACVEAGINASTAATQYSQWRRDRQPSTNERASAANGGATSKESTMATRKRTRKQAADTETVEGGEQEAKPEQETQNGVSRPRPGGATARVWELADEISSREGRPAVRKEVMDQFVAEGGNISTAATQYGRWRKFYGIEAQPRRVHADTDAEVEVEADA